nr:immunoglobulin light chain junction region [Macaca mulatta]
DYYCCAYADKYIFG